MSYFEFPHTRDYEGDLGFIIKRLEELTDAYNNFFDYNTIKFHDPIEWNIKETYPANNIVYDKQSETFYIAKQAVPAGIDISNIDYWLLITPFKVDTVLSTGSINPIANKAVATKFNSVDATTSDLNSRLNTEITTRATADNDISTRVSTNTNAIGTETTNRTAADNLINARIDEILEGASVDPDAELLDIRVGGNGITYASAGAAVRAQYTENHNAITALTSDYDDFAALDIDFDVAGFINKTTGAIVSHSDYHSTDFISIKGIMGGIRFIVKSVTNVAVFALYDANHNFISSYAIDSGTVVETTGSITDYSGAAYIRFCSVTAGSYEPALKVANLEDLNLYGKCVELDNITFTQHDPKTNLIDPDTLMLGYIDGAVDGSVHVSTTIYCTPFIELKNNTDYYFNENYFYPGYCAFYNANKEYISGYGASAPNNKLNAPFTIPDNAKYGRFSIATASRIPNAWLCEYNRMSVKPADYAEEVKTRFIPDIPTEYKGSDICIFKKILCIGDSLTEGFFNENGGSRLVMPERSYPAQLAKLTGIEVSNYGYSGYTSVDWYNAYASTDLSGYDCCIIQLGVNDQLQNVSQSDMNTALTNIINKIESENYGIKIFVADITPGNGYLTTAMRSRSDMIKAFVNNLNDANVYLLDLWSYSHIDDSLAYDAGHLSAYGYFKLAEDYKAYISWIINKNPLDFRYVQFIGTDYTYSGNTYTRIITY